MRLLPAVLLLALAVPAASPGGEPTLAETVAFIERSLLDDGREIYVGDNRIVAVHSDACRIGWTHAEIGNRFSGSVIKTKELSFADLDASQIKGWDSIGMLRVVTYNSEPKIQIHATRYYNNVRSQKDSNVTQLELEFQDARVAERVAKAFEHAARLCGAKETKDPF